MGETTLTTNSKQSQKRIESVGNKKISRTKVPRDKSQTLKTKHQGQKSNSRTIVSRTNTQHQENQQKINGVPRPKTPKGRINLRLINTPSIGTNNKKYPLNTINKTKGTSDKIDKTPCRKLINKMKPKKLFETKIQNYIEMEKKELVPEDMNMELVLVNSLKINALKVQTVIENFIKDKEHTCIFCLTETKVDSLDFDPQGVKLFTEHRNKEEKKGGGLIIGFKEEEE